MHNNKVVLLLCGQALGKRGALVTGAKILKSPLYPPQPGGSMTATCPLLFQFEQDLASAEYLVIHYVDDQGNAKKWQGCTDLGPNSNLYSLHLLDLHSPRIVIFADDESESARGGYPTVEMTLEKVILISMEKYDRNIDHTVRDPFQPFALWARHGIEFTRFS